MAYLIYGCICHREGHKTKIPVCNSRSRANYTLYRVLWYGESNGTIFVVPTFVVKWFRRHIMMMISKVHLMENDTLLYYYILFL